MIAVPLAIVVTPGAAVIGHLMESERSGVSGDA
jgi:hypothetical protein